MDARARDQAEDRGRQTDCKNRVAEEANHREVAQIAEGNASGVAGRKIQDGAHAGIADAGHIDDFIQGKGLGREEEEQDERVKSEEKQESAVGGNRRLKCIRFGEFSILV